MPRTLITVTLKPVFTNDGLLIRLIEPDDEQNYYLSCWSLPWHLTPQDRPEPLEDFEARNWKCPLSTREVQDWLEALQYQTIVVAPEPDETQWRDGTTCEFIYEADGARLHLSWCNEIPRHWKPVGSLVQRMIQVARTS